MSGINLSQKLAKFFGNESNAPRKENRRRVLISCELNEERVVLSHMGGMPGGRRGMGTPPAEMGTMTPRHEMGANFLGSLGQIGVASGAGKFGGGGFGGRHGGDHLPTSTDPAIQTLIDNLTTATTKMQTDQQALAAKSSVTVADINAVMTDSKAIADAGATLDKTALDAAMNTLARAVASGSDTTEAKTAFDALFTGTTVSQTTIDQTFTDLVKVITDSNVTTEDLDLIASDKAAITTAQQALTDAGYKFGRHGDGTCPTSTTSTTSTTTSSSTTASTSSTSSTTSTASTLAAASRTRRTSLRASRLRTARR